MVTPASPNYRYHQNRPPSQENPKFNCWEIFWAHRHFNWRMDFSARTPVADHNISSYKTACDIHLKHVFLTELGMWRNPAPKLRHIPFRFFGYHKLAWTVVILNLSKDWSVAGRPHYMVFPWQGFFIIESHAKCKAQSFLNKVFVAQF